MVKTLLSFITGVVFAAGLIIGGMTQPSKVIGFLDVAGDWDPSLALVMGAAIAVFSPLYHLVRRRGKVAFSQVIWLPPPNRPVDLRLLVGSALFGVGWGLGGYCPGPGLVALGSMGAEAVVFVAAMALGMFLFKLFDRSSARVPAPAPTSRTTAP